MWFTTKFLIGLYVFFNTWFFFKWGFYTELSDPMYYVIHALSILMIVCYSEFFNYILKRKYSRILWGIFLITLYVIAAKYRYRVRTGFDYAILHDNFWEMFNGEVTGVVESTVKMKDFMQAFAMIPIMIFLQFKYKVFTKNLKPSFKKAFVALASFVVLIATAPIPYGELSYIFSSAWDFHFGGYPKSENYQKIAEVGVEKKEIKSSYPERRPNIFILEIESFNGLYVNQKTEEGNEITPVFNKLVTEGLLVDDFYGNSIQSIKGQFATLCSRYPLIRGKASYDIKSVDKLNCFPKVLKDLGYNSLFHKSYWNLDFDNTQKFMKAIGFDDVKSTNYGVLSETERKRYVWGWGIQDNYSYKQYLDNVQQLMTEGKPVFSIIHTVSHHMKFNHVPKEESKLYGDRMPKNKHEAFLNSLNTTDRYIGEFFADLKARGLDKNSIVIITGDHSYPAGEHSLFDNQTSYFQEFFKTPLLILWPEVIAPEVVKGKTYSHVDILPTVLDLIGYNGMVDTVGTSIMPKTGSIAHLIQPYNGTYLGVVKWPWKYIWERRVNREFLYNLELDPFETKRIYDEKLFSELRPEIDHIIYSFETLYKK